MTNQEFINYLKSKNHDLRSPLATIKSFFNIIEVQKYHTTDPDFIEMKEQIVESLDNWQKLMDEVSSNLSQTKE
jgi:light-regulated signal transduction histidine kinase (bacteriophytochrome)